MQGSGGGIGRLELVLAEMLEVLLKQRKLEFRTVAREPHPQYLRQKGSATDGRRIGKAGFTLSVMREFLGWKPDTVIFSHVNQAPIGLAMRLLRPRAKQVVLVYGWDVWFGVSGLRRQGLGQLDRVWSISEFTSRKLSQTTGYPAGRIKLLVPVLTQEQSRWFAGPGDSQSAAHAHVRLLSIARLDATERQKGIDHVLNATQRLMQEFPQLTYTIVGDGSDRPRLEEIARELKIDRSVVFAGRAGPSELSALYRACDIFVLPSAQEGFGLVFLEAMAAGKAVIAARAGAAPEVVVDRVTGLLVDYGDVGGLASAIARLARDPELRERMGQAGRSRYLEKFSFEEATNRLAELLQDLSLETSATESLSGSGSTP
jgi:glycosyltransferase involved in cell wall biosynthesis